MRQEDAPSEGWYLEWLGSDGELRTTRLLTGASIAPPIDDPATGVVAAKLVGIVHDDYLHSSLDLDAS